MRKRDIAAIILTVLCTAFIVFYAMNVAKNRSVPEQTVEIATVETIDTARFMKPEPVTAEVIKVKSVKLKVKSGTARNGLGINKCAYVDSLSHNVDSIDVVIPIERKVYQDSNYRAVVSGYDVSLDTIEVYARHEITTIRHTVTTSPKRWGIGLAAGYGVTPKGLQPFVGVSVTYTIFRF